MHEPILTNLSSYRSSFTCLFEARTAVIVVCDAFHSLVPFCLFDHTQYGGKRGGISYLLLSDNKDSRYDLTSRNSTTRINSTRSRTCQQSHTRITIQTHLSNSPERTLTGEPSRSRPSLHSQRGRKTQNSSPTLNSYSRSKALRREDERITNDNSSEWLDEAAVTGVVWQRLTRPSVPGCRAATYEVDRAFLLVWNATQLCSFCVAMLGVDRSGIAQL